MERLTESYEKYMSGFSEEFKGNRTGYSMNSNIIYEKLGAYEDLEEQGKLLKLPCAVGDTVYTLNPLPGGKTVIAETTADAFFCAICTIEERFGKTVFLTKREAETILKNL